MTLYVRPKNTHFFSLYLQPKNTTLNVVSLNHRTREHGWRLYREHPPKNQPDPKGESRSNTFDSIPFFRAPLSASSPFYTPFTPLSVLGEERPTDNTSGLYPLLGMYQSSPICPFPPFLFHSSSNPPSKKLLPSFSLFYC